MYGPNPVTDRYTVIVLYVKGNLEMATHLATTSHVVVMAIRSMNVVINERMGCKYGF